MAYIPDINRHFGISMWNLTSNSVSVSGNPNKLPSRSSPRLSLSSVICPEIGCGLSRMIYILVDAPKCISLSIGTCCGFFDSNRILPIKVPCAEKLMKKIIENCPCYNNP